MHLAQIMLSQSCAKTAINSELSIKIDQKLAKNSLKGKTFWKKRWPSRRKNRQKQINFSKLSRVPFVAVGVYCFCPWRYCLEEAISLLASLIALMLHCSGDTQMMMKRHKNCQRLLWGLNVNVSGWFFSTWGYTGCPRQWVASLCGWFFSSCLKLRVYRVSQAISLLAS